MKMLSRNILIVFSLALTFNKTFGQDLSRVRKNIDSLTAPSMHGRGAEFEGDKKAANFLAKKFQEIGLKKFNNQYQQPFNYPINTFPGKLSLKINGQSLCVGKDFIVSPGTPSKKGKAKVIFLDTLIFSDEKAQKAFLVTKLKNKAIVYSAKDKKRIQKLPIEIQKKIQETVALVELHDKKLTASLAGEQSEKPIFEILKEAFPATTKKIEFEVQAELLENYPSQNVIGFIEGKKDTDSFIVITAHYDHIGRMGKATYFPGANDNASGVSMLLELAHHYSRPENQPEYNIAFMAFGAEEAGLIGSRFYTENPLFPLSKIKFLVNLDLLGTGDEGMMVVNGAVHEKEFSLLTEINNSKNLLPAIKKRGPAANSDHYFFSQKGVPAFFFYTLGGISAYHDVFDRPETLPLTEYKDVFLLITDFVEAVSTK